MSISQARLQQAAERRERVLALERKQLPVAVISQRTGLSETRVHDLLKEAGVQVQSSRQWF